MTDLIRRFAFLVPFLLVTGPVLEAHAQTACGAAQIKAAGKKVSGKAGCYSKAYKTGDPVSADCLGKVEAKFLLAYAKAVEKGDCPGDATAVGVEELVDVCIGELTTAISPGVSPAECANAECNDEIDNDGDGKIDGADEECVAACDDSEGNFDNTVAGLSYACTLDCFFDQNTGSGDDDCKWTHVCDPNEVAPLFHPAGETCAYDPNVTLGGASCSELHSTQSANCDSTCGGLAPNGCDCFGCCELVAGSGNFGWIGSRDANGDATCTRATANDSSKCRPCSPVSACLNTCGTCELCMGRTEVAMLPPECGGTVACEAGSSPCPCAEDEYCVTGCCQPRPE
jgi:hypothetical protein